MPSTPSTPLPDDPLARGSRQAVVRLQQAGHLAYWVGGCVRDLFLGRPPKDYDIATDAHPEQVVALFPQAVQVGKSFGVVRVPIDDHWYEVATFRCDHAYHDGRHPESITFTDPRTDAERRDFTVNALFFDPVTAVCHDYVDGRADLTRRLIRAVGDPATRFREDHLRLLRAVRFAATLDFTIEPATADAIRLHAALVASVSAERIRDELVRTLCEARHPGRALRQLDDLGLLVHILPEVVALKHQAQPPEFHPEGDVFTHTAGMLDLMESPTPVLAFAVLLHDIGKPPTATVDETGRIRFNCHADVGADMADAILRRLKFSNDDREAVVGAVRGHMRFQDVPNMRRSTLRTMVGRPHFPMELELHRLDCLGSHHQLGIHAQVRKFQEELASEPALPPPWIRGRDLLTLGIATGPELGKWLRVAYEAQLEGTHPDRDALLAWLVQQLPAK